MSDEIHITPEILQSFLSNIIKLEKRYAHSDKGAKSERRSKVVEAVEETSARELDRA